jgi:hypothetical protein
MAYLRLLPVLLILASYAVAQEEEELTPYSVVEIESYLKVFKDTYKDRKLPEEDAVAVLEDLRKAYLFLASKGDELEKPEESAKRDIVKYVSRGLKARKRPLVTLECANVLGQIADPDGAKPLLQWMDRVVLDMKSVNTQWVEYGFRSMAAIGSEDSQTIDLVRSYATGKHVDPAVASHAIAAAGNWRQLKGKTRKELFEKILGYVGGLYSNSKGGDPKKRGSFEKKFKAVEEAAMKTLSELAGVDTPFKSPPEAQSWWKDNKRARWEEYVGPLYRKKAAEPKKDSDD